VAIDFNTDTVHVTDGFEMMFIDVKRNDDIRKSFVTGKRGEIIIRQIDGVTVLEVVDA
jgi:hypothetical protein